MSKLTKLGARRLLKLATILDTADALHKKRDEDPYTQTLWTRDCGTPACALGHWAHHNRRRWAFGSRGWFGRMPYLKREGTRDVWSDAQTEFGIDGRDWDDLFSNAGCGGAKTAKQAAKYIRSFVARKGVA